MCRVIIVEPAPTDLFVRGFIAGLHATSRGSHADLRFCEAHEQAIRQAVSTYVGSGVKRRSEPA